MPFRDHFHPPFSRIVSWEQFHGQWPGAIVRQLNTTLPPQYRAGPTVHLGREAEVDVGTFESQSSWAASHGQAGNGGPAVAVWRPRNRRWPVETDLADFDAFEVCVYDTSRDAAAGGRRRTHQPRQQGSTATTQPIHREVRVAVAEWCIAGAGGRGYGALLQSVRRSARFDRPVGPVAAAQPPATYAVACCWRPRGASRWLETWNRELKPGLPLPCLPLWLTEDLAITLDLEASYEQTCRDLRID